MSELLRLGALEVTFALVFTVLALVDVAHLRRQSKQLMRRIEMSRLEAHNLADLSVAHAALQRRYSQAQALIHLMAEFNQLMEFQAVLDRLSRGLSRFFAGDDVTIWMRSTGESFDLAAEVREDIASAVGPDSAWLSTVLAEGSIVLPPAWQQSERPWMAAPLLDWRGMGLGVIVLASHRRSAYTAEDADFLRAVLGHAAMAIHNAARFEVADRLSRLDPLTGLGNRGDFDRALHEGIARALITAGSLSVLLADVDHFKQINDSRGHPEGDRVLRRVAQLIAQGAGAPNRAFRIGGEEFAVLLAQAKATALSVAMLLCARVGKEVFFDDETRLTLSIGVASLPDDGRDPGTLMAAADQALYQAKADGRNRVHVA
jgi:diguanylate cyclase (GGDEF)-like protein